MNFRRTIFITAATALGVASLGIANAAGSDPYEPHTVTVKYDELDMSTQQGAKELYARLRAASKQVCARLDGRDLREHAAFRACYEQALGDAVLHVNRESVTALHQRATHGERAS
jgi:UrcA family protein